MTREEILKLEPGSELDRLVAERVMGWQESSDFAIEKETGDLLKIDLSDSIFKGLWKWSPSTDIAAAWEVVRKMLDSGWGCEIYSPNNPYALENADKWFVVFAKSEQPDFRARALFAPLAICRAALLAVMKGEK